MKSVELMLEWKYKKKYFIITAFAHVLHADHADKSIIIIKWQKNCFSQMPGLWLDPEEFIAQICLMYL